MELLHSLDILFNVADTEPPIDEAVEQAVDPYGPWPFIVVVCFLLFVGYKLWQWKLHKLWERFNGVEVSPFAHYHGPHGEFTPPQKLQTDVDKFWDTYKDKILRSAINSDKILKLMRNFFLEKYFELVMKM